MKPEMKAQILNLKAQGKTNIETSVAVGCTTRTVQRTLQEYRLDNACQQAHAVEKSIQHYQVTESKRTRSLASSLRTVEQELSKRSFADISTSQLLQIAFKLRHQVQKLEDRNEQRLEKAFKIQEQEYGDQESTDEMTYRIPNQPSPSAETPVQPASVSNPQPSASTVQQPTAPSEPNKTRLTVLPDPTEKPQPMTGKKWPIAPADHYQYRTPAQARAHAVVQSAVKSIPQGKAAGESTHSVPKGESKPLVSYTELKTPKLELTQPLVGSLRYNSNIMEVAHSQEFEKKAA